MTAGKGKMLRRFGTPSQHGNTQCTLFAEFNHHFRQYLDTSEAVTLRCLKALELTRSLI